MLQNNESIKGCVRYIFPGLFLSLNKSICQTRNIVFYFTSKALFSLRKSNFRILHFQISWRHQMPKDKARNTFQWITWEIQSVNEIWPVMSYYKRKKFIKKLYKNCGLKTSSRPFYVCKELSTTFIGEWNFWNKLLVLNM